MESAISVAFQNSAEQLKMVGIEFDYGFHPEEELCYSGDEDFEVDESPEVTTDGELLFLEDRGKNIQTTCNSNSIKNPAAQLEPVGLEIDYGFQPEEELCYSGDEDCQSNDSSVVETNGEILFLEDRSRNVQTTNNVEITDSSSISTTSEDEKICQAEQTSNQTTAVNGRCGEFHGILKRKSNRSSDDAAVEESWDLLCSVPEGDQLREAANQVFMDFCFQEFFEGGCLDGTCRSNHRCSLNMSVHPTPVIWNACLYLMVCGTQLNVLLVKALINFFCVRGAIDKIILFGKCFSKIKYSDVVDFFNHLVDSLSTSIERQKALTRVLKVAYAELASDVFNEMLCEFDFLDSHRRSFLNILLFLDSNEIGAPVRFLLNVLEFTLENILEHENNEELFTAISNSIARLPETEFNEIRLSPAFINFSEVFKNKLFIKCSTHSKVKPNKRVRFVEETNVPPDDFDEEVPVPMSTDEPEDWPMDEDFASENPIEPTNRLSEIVGKFYGSLCKSWVLDGRCTHFGCLSDHNLEPSTVDDSPENLRVAVDFFIDCSNKPNFKVLKALLNATREVPRILLFRKIAHKLSPKNKIKLTNLILTKLSSTFSCWEAFEMVLMPSHLLQNTISPEGDLSFSSRLLRGILLEAVLRKNVLPRMVLNAILRRIRFLPEEESLELLDISLAFIQKFIVRSDNISAVPKQVDDFSVFSSRFLSALRTGFSNKYFVACVMFKFATERGRKVEIRAILYEFLLNQVERAQILEQLIKNCCYFSRSSKVLLVSVFGEISASLCLRIFQKGNIRECSAILEICLKYKFKLFGCESSSYGEHPMSLAMMCCRVLLELERYHEAAEAFLSHCLESSLTADEYSSTFCNELNSLLALLFKGLASKMLIKELKNIFCEIFARQRALVFPLNIFRFYELVLRSIFLEPKADMRRDILQLFLDVENLGIETHLTKATCRSLLMLAAEESSVYSSGNSSIFHPLVRKLLVKCIKVEAYAPFATDPTAITLSSSMSEDEIKIYLFWWLKELISTQKSLGLHRYDFPVTLTVAQASFVDELALPIHLRLKNVNVTKGSCVSRISRICQHLISCPWTSEFLVSKEGNSYELSPMLILKLCETVVLEMQKFEVVESSGLQKFCANCLLKNETELVETNPNSEKAIGRALDE